MTGVGSKGLREIRTRKGTWGILFNSLQNEILVPELRGLKDIQATSDELQK